MCLLLEAARAVTLDASVLLDVALVLIASGEKRAAGGVVRAASARRGQVFNRCNTLSEANCVVLLTDPATSNAETTACFRKIHYLNPSNFRKELLEITSKLYKT